MGTLAIKQGVTSITVDVDVAEDAVVLRQHSSGLTDKQTDGQRTADAETSQRNERVGYSDFRHMDCL